MVVITAVDASIPFCKGIIISPMLPVAIINQIEEELITSSFCLANTIFLNNIFVIVIRVCQINDSSHSYD
jgi:hypothetical protein